MSPRAKLFVSVVSSASTDLSVEVITGATRLIGSKGGGFLLQYIVELQWLEH